MTKFESDGTVTFNLTVEEWQTIQQSLKTYRADLETAKFEYFAQGDDSMVARYAEKIRIANKAAASIM